MKTNFIFTGAVLISLLTGCVSRPMAVAPVGPDPVASVGTVSQGGLEVYSRLVKREEGNNPTWRQHSDYYVYDLQGNLVKRVQNTVGNYETAPRLVYLPAGQYIVKAGAKDYLSVQIPVTVENGRISTIHLDDQWAPPSYMANNEVVRMPNGQPVGWGR